MAKTLKQVLETYAPRSDDEKRFIDKHVVVKHPDRNGNGDDVFKAKRIKVVKRAPDHGHEVGKDAEVYEGFDGNSKATVGSMKYSWGTMKTVHHGNDFSIPLHPEHHRPISKLGDGESHSFTDETRTRWKATRDGDRVNFSGAGKKTSVPLKSLHEDADINENYERLQSLSRQMSRLQKRHDAIQGIHPDKKALSIKLAKLKKEHNELFNGQFKEDVDLNESAKERPGHFAFTHTPGDTESERKLATLKSVVSDHNKTSDFKLRVLAKGRMGKDNPKAEQYKRDRNGRTGKPHGYQTIALHDAKHHDLYVAPRNKSDSSGRSHEDQATHHAIARNVTSNFKQATGLNMHEETKQLDEATATIHAPGNRMHGKIGRVFHDHGDGRVNVQITNSAKKGDVTNLTLKKGEYKLNEDTIEEAYPSAISLSRKARAQKTLRAIQTGYAKQKDGKWKTESYKLPDGRWASRDVKEDNQAQEYAKYNRFNHLQKVPSKEEALAMSMNKIKAAFGKKDKLKEETLNEQRGFKAPELEAAGYKFKSHSAAGAGSPASTLYHHPELDKHIEITHERVGMAGAKKRHYFYAGKYGSHNGGSMQSMHWNLNDAIRKNNGELKEANLDEARPDFYYQTGPGAKPKKTFNLSKYLENNDKKVAAIKKKAAAGVSRMGHKSNGKGFYVGEETELTEAPYYSLQASKERMAKEKARAAAKEAVAAAKKKAAEDRKGAKADQSHMIARHIEAEVGNHYPDSDGYDAIASKLHKMGIGRHDAITHMDKAARKHLGAKSFSHFVDNFHKDYGS